MALAQLTDEQTRTWTREQKDRWCFENIYRGDLPQLTIRSAVTGFLLGGILSATNLYVGGKTGVTLGVGLTSVILAFAMFRLLTRIGLGKDFTILENNAMQSIATAAGYMTMPVTSGTTGLTLPGMMDEPGWSGGRLISASPARGPEARRIRSLAIFASLIATLFSADE